MLDSAQIDLINALARERDQTDVEISRLDNPQQSQPASRPMTGYTG
jgi:hypothetical protein